MMTLNMKFDKFCLGIQLPFLMFFIGGKVWGKFGYIRNFMFYIFLEQLKLIVFQFVYNVFQ